MQKYKMLAWSIFLALGISSGAMVANAAASPELSQVLEEQISKTDDAFQQADASVQSANPEMAIKDGWFFRRMWLRLRFTAGIKIPMIFTLKFIPETEMLWERPIPAGWAVYKKQN